MNVLTKLFVVTLVVLALLETAAFVVFVQRVQVTQKAHDGMETKMKVAQAAQLQAEAEQAGLNATIGKLQNEAAIRIANDRKTVAAHQQTIAEKENLLAEANKQIGTLQLDMANLSNQSQLLATILDAKDKQLTAVRTEADAVNKKYDEVARALQDVQARAEVLKREWEASQEIRAKLEADLAIAQKGGVQSVVPNAGGMISAAVKLNGRVTKVTKDTNGQLLASINLGRADSVAKGMRFTVYDNEKGVFLGFLIVQAVDTNEAIGVIEGPKVTEIAVGNAVQNQM